ncbi:hypothetical protein GALL_462150 [mine drainage metagenome]|uniref:Uncharacterized protein n=1 Tax=mine drainage metagenome TaxID=410659 RepID=A0A1J5PKT6_9ZZZZ
MRGRNRKPCACTSRNTAAASVDATTAPASSASVQFRSSAYLATGAVTSAVSSTPIVASIIDGASTALIFCNRVFKPPSNRISARATDPTR